MDNIGNQETYLKGNPRNNNNFDNTLVIPIELLKQLEVIARCQELQLVRKLDIFRDNLQTNS